MDKKPEYGTKKWTTALGIEDHIMGKMPEYRGPNNGLHAEYGGLYNGLHGVVWRTTL